VIAVATAADLPELASLMAESDLLRRYRVDAAAALRSLSAALDAGDLLLVSRISHGLAAMAWLSFAPRMLNGAAYLRLLLVANEARSTGIGSELLTAAEASAREQANHLYLLATTDNSGARRFYERHGYRLVGTLPGLVRPDLDEALYHKSLRAHAERLTM
jgi:ribosomal protein S18 acetylase RimI-like enzyme